HIGIATQTPAGLLVPAVRHCEALGLWDCAAEVGRLAEAARAGRATREELAGSTVTITSLGALGGIVTTPVINRPEVAIVGVDRPTIDFARTIEWKDGIVGRLTSGVGALLKRHRVKILQGHATMVDGKTCRVESDTGPQVIRAEHVVLATGSVAASLPALPFGGRVISSTEALSLPAIPGRLAVVGAGYIGLELGTAFAKLGAKVTVVEAEDRILPVYDAELARPVARRLQALGVEVVTRARAAALDDA